ncbi:MAG TPA: response regulator [Thermoanaerobaculia bacterium]|nr:response regulator [Thermoanaerobaculia bacterium]
MKVLVVDDDYAVLDAFKDVLEDEGYEVSVAANGLEALKELRQGARPDVILLDLMMPVMNGWEFRQEQLRDQALSAIPTVIVTAHNRPEESAKELGVVSCIRKPVKPELLLSTVGKFRG